MSTCQHCGGPKHLAPRQEAASIAMGYPLTVCFVNRVLDDFDGDRERTITWLDAWAGMGSEYYVTPSYYRAHLISPQN